MRNKKIIITILVVFLIVLVFLFLFDKPKTENIVFYLVGNNNIELSFGDNYQEEGFIAHTETGIDLKQYVNISGKVNTNILGKQQIIYTLDYENYHNTLIRNIVIFDVMKDYTCNVTKRNSGYTIEVLPKDNENHEIIIDGNIQNYSNSLVINNNISSIKLINQSKSGVKKEIDCNIKDEMLYHFQYDEYNKREFIKCNTYSGSDKLKLEDILKKVISEVGYGTRAGVVEAARFLAGGLDYKIPYLGPKKVDSTLGRYEHVGLNIGSNGWGCMVSGWTQGIDCTNFVKWAFIQNGLTISPYNSTNTHKVNSVLNQIRVGDLFLVPCIGTCNSDYQHVGIVVGIDETYFYVAEATTGNINAVVVNKYEKNNMPTKEGFSIVKLIDYQSDGNITNMWIK